MWYNIREEAITFMQEHRTQRLRGERRIVLEKRIRALREAYAKHFTSRGKAARFRHDGVELTPGDLAYLPEFVQLLEADNDVEVSESSFVPLLGQERWPDYVAQWQERIKRQLRAIVVSTLNSTESNMRVDETADVLELAIAHFLCGDSSCGYRSKALRWQDVLSHSCCRHNVCGPRGTGSFSDFDRCVSLTCHGEVFRLPVLVLSPTTKEVVIACGQDPGKVTFEEMQACPIRLVCSQLPDSHFCPTPRPALDWLAAVSVEGIFLRSSS